MRITYRAAQTILRECGAQGFYSLPNEESIRILDRASGEPGTEEQADEWVQTHKTPVRVEPVTPDTFDSLQKITGLLMDANPDNTPKYVLDGATATDWNEKFQVLLLLVHNAKRKVFDAAELAPIALDDNALSHFLTERFAEHI